MFMAEVFPVDNSAALRRNPNKPVRVIAVTGGKGGVGKTNVSVNLAMALADSGKQVMLMDADLGLGNIDVMLGLNPKLTLQHVIDGSHSLEDVMVEGPKGVRIVPAASGVQRMAELSPGEHGALIRAFSELSFDLDVLLVDTAAGISDSVISFTRAAQDVVVVVCDEPASITDAYALIKLLNREQDVFRFRVLVNMASNARQAREVYEKIARVSDRFLDVALDYMGHVPRDDFLVSAIRKQRAVVEAFPHSNAASAFRALVEKVDKWPLPVAAGGHIEFFFERLIDGNLHETEVMP